MKRLSQWLKLHKNKLEIHQALTVKTFKRQTNSSMYAISYLNDLAKNNITTVYIALIVDDDYIDVQDLINEPLNLIKLEYENGQWYDYIDDKPKKLEDSVKYWNLDDDDIILILY